MSKFLRFGLISGLMFVAEFASANVIYSTCPVPLTDQNPAAVNLETADRFRPDEFRLKIRSYSKEFPKAFRYVRWLMSSEPDSRDGKIVDAEAARVGLWAEDLELLNAMAADQNSCHNENSPVTQPLAIIPFARRLTTAEGKNDYRVVFKVCEYLVRKENQMLFENACRVLGRESGYTFEELRARFDQLKVHIEDSKSGIDAAIVGAGILAALPTFRTMRFLRAGNLTSLAVSLLPSGAAYYALQQDWSEEFIRDIVDFKDANEIALTGDLSKSVGVNMPMEDFMSYFARYLESLN